MAKYQQECVTFGHSFSVGGTFYVRDPWNQDIYDHDQFLKLVDKCSTNDILSVDKGRMSHSKTYV